MSQNTAADLHTPSSNAPINPFPDALPRYSLFVTLLLLQVYVQYGGSSMKVQISLSARHSSQLQ
uniref:Uncharacterized protein n=1 Tax=Anguilla anguilla TaxID=7936 RepID=A0A0E9PAM8_ANGAN